MSDIKRELKRCPICGSLPRYWQWNHGAMVECWCKDHRIQCEGKTLEEAVEAWERRADVEPVQRWIPVTDGLPEEEGQYLVSCDSDFAIEVARFYIDEEEDRWFGCDWNDPEDIVAWMPLPEPYKEGDEK